MICMFIYKIRALLSEIGIRNMGYHISISTLQGKMKLAKSLFRTVSLLSFSKVVPKARVNPYVLTATSLTAVSAFWLTSQKIMSEEQITLEIEDNIQEGEVKEVQVGPKPEDTVLVIRYEGKLYCIQSKCAHFGFSLAKGILVGDKIICPLHNAGFNIKTGQQDQGPIFDGLKTFPVQKTSDGKIKLTVPKLGWQDKPKRVLLGKANVDNSKKIVIIGGGPAGLAAAESLRDTGYNGVIYMVSKETQLPYDRTMLSKMSDAVKAPGPIRDSETLAEDGIVFVGGKAVTSIDYEYKKVLLDTKQFLGYDKLLIATGCVNRYPPIPGLDKTKFSSLRSKKDYEEINKAVRSEGVKNVTIIGGGFIGIETASAIKLALKEGINVTVLEQGEAPLERVVGKDIGKVLQGLAIKNGVNFVTSARIKGIQPGANGRPQKVILDNGDVPTDVLIMATGVKTALDFAPELVDPETNGIKTNAFLETSRKDVYAAGDVASYPFWYTGKTARIEHFNEAIYQGAVAASNMAGKKFPMDNIPFFWTRSFNNSLAVTGVLQGWNDIHITGSLEEGKFVAYYIDKGSDMVLGAAAMNMPNSIQIINQAMRNGVMPKASVIKSGSANLQQILKETKAKNPKCSRCTRCAK